MNPLSNAEVLKVLKGRKNHTKMSKDFKDYLEMIDTEESNYKMENLRKIKDISPEVLCMVANNQSIEMIDSNYDIRKIKDSSNIL